MDRMTGLTDQLLSYAQEGEYQSKIVSIHKLVEDTLALVQHGLDPLIRITPWYSCDIWLSERSVKTTEYSSSPSGSTSGRKPGIFSSSLFLCPTKPS